MEGRPDLAAYFEGCKTAENFLLLRQGGLERRPGTRFVAETKATNDAILVRFEFSVDEAYILEFGHHYIRFYKNGLQIMSGGLPVEIVSPYAHQELRDIHFTQSADVLFLFHPDHQQKTLTRVSDTAWVIADISPVPPPSFEADVDLSGGTITLTPGATTGSSIVFTASAAVFLEADVGRQIISGASRANIVAFGSSAGDTASPNDQVRADIVVAFPNTNPIPAGSWLIRLSPQATLDPNKKEPVGALVTLVAGANAFRTTDVGKFIKIYDGVVEITNRDSATQVRGLIRSVLTAATAADPAAAPAGSWLLEERSWSSVRGFPRTGEFIQGRLAEAGTKAQPTTWWMSASDDFDNFALGTLADNAVEFTIASRQVNRIEWLAENIDMFIGTAGAEVRVRGTGTDDPISGDKIPLVQAQTSEGSSHIQPVVASRKVIFVDRSRLKVYQMSYAAEEEGFDALEITDIAEHITKPGIRLGPIGFQRRPDPVIYMVRTDGVLIALTFFLHQKVLGFTRFVTDGTFEAVAVIPRSADRDEVWVIVKRTIQGLEKRFVEYFQPDGLAFTDRPWQGLHTDSAIRFQGPSTTVIPVPHLESKTVDVVADGAFRGPHGVSGGIITLAAVASEVEAGLSYDSKAVTMRPAIEGSVLEGLPRIWDKLFVRLHETVGGTVNGEPLTFVPDDLDTLMPFTGDRDVTGSGWDTEGRITVEQTQPYPMTLLAVFGELTVGPHG